MPDDILPEADELQALKDEVVDGLRALWHRPPPGAPDAKRRLWRMWAAVKVATLDQCIMATRPFTDADSRKTVQLYWLLPLAAGIAEERWRAFPGDASNLARYAAGSEYRNEYGRLEAKVHLVMRAILNVQSARAALQTVRLGKEWVKDVTGARLPIAPVNLDYPSYLRWFVAQVLREARRLLRHDAARSGEWDKVLANEGAPANTSTVPYQKASQPAEDRTDVEAWLDFHEGLPDQTPRPHENVRDPGSPLGAIVLREQVDAIYAAARDDTDRALLDGLSEGKSIAEIARELGIKEGTARQRKARLAAHVKRTG